MQRLKRTRQCAKCPWKVGVDPFDIPHGYDPEAHRAIGGTIAKPGALDLAAPLRVMACHAHPVGHEVACVGWLAHQLGPGNNIKLRLWARHVENFGKLRVVGPQHERFEDTLPSCPAKDT